MPHTLQLNFTTPHDDYYKLRKHLLQKKPDIDSSVIIRIKNPYQAEVKFQYKPRDRHLNQFKEQIVASYEDLEAITNETL